jgi:anion-transporting  ArsA/GET3 family ATPase
MRVAFSASGAAEESMKLLHPKKMTNTQIETWLKAHQKKLVEINREIDDLEFVSRSSQSALRRLETLSELGNMLYNDLRAMKQERSRRRSPRVLAASEKSKAEKG